MKIIARKIVHLVAVSCVLLVSCAAPLSKNQNYSGSYQSVASDTDSRLSLEINQEGDSAKIELSAGNVSGRGTAPDASGTGKITTDGSLRFTFEDSFENKGSGELKPEGKFYRIKWNALEFKDSRAGEHYTERLLNKK